MVGLEKFPKKNFFIFFKKPIDKTLKKYYNNIVPRERNKKIKGSDQRRKGNQYDQQRIL